MKGMQRWIETHREVFTYLVFGVLTTVVNYIVYFAATRLFQINYLFANGLAWVVAVLFAYWTNRRWVFESRVRGKGARCVEFIKFVGGRVASLLIDMAIMYLGITVLGLLRYDVVVKTVAQVFVIVANYVISKYFVFVK